MRVGYARVSTVEQNLRMQTQALEQCGCERIFCDEGVSGNAVIKPNFGAAIDFCREGDELIVWRLDRLARSLPTLIELVAMFEDRKIGLRLLHEQIDTTSPGGRLFFHIMGALAQFERDIIIDRTKAGIAAARQAGTHLGRPFVITPEKWSEAQNVIASDPLHGVRSAAIMMGVTPQAVYARLRKERHASK